MDAVSLKTTLRALFHATGGLHVTRFLHRNRARILMYHRFPAGAQRSLEAQCQHLREHYSFVSLSDIAAWLRGETEIPQNSLCVTVDDGYRDFFTSAYPVFSRYRVPVTVFLTTGFLDRECWLWVDRFHYSFERTKARNFEIALPSGELLRMELDSAEKKGKSCATLKRLVKRLPEAERLRVTEELPRLLNVDIPASPPPEYEPLRWSEARQMAAAGVAFGAHTRTHPILSQVLKARMQDEVASSKARIEQVLDVPVRHFCYPNGRWQKDFGAEAVTAVREAGFETAVTADPGLNGRTADAFLLKRIGVEPGLRELYFRECVAGLRKSGGS